MRVLEITFVLKQIVCVCVCVNIIAVRRYRHLQFVIKIFSLKLLLLVILYVCCGFCKYLTKPCNGIGSSNCQSNLTTPHTSIVNEVTHTVWIVSALLQFKGKIKNWLFE